MQVLQWGDPVGNWIAQLSTQSGKLVLRAPSFPLSLGPTKHWKSSFIPLDSDLTPGVYTLEILNSQGQRLSQGAVRLLHRDFIHEDIPLSRDLTQLRSVPDPQKEAEAREIQDLYQQFNSWALYHRGSVSLPIVEAYRETSFYGDRRRYIYSDGTTARSFHLGMDLAAPTGTPLTAPAPGRVVLAKSRIVTGLTVVIEHMPGVYSVYMHLHRSLVTLGQWVGQGDSLGTIGSTGLATGPHLHWEWRVNGIAVDPKVFLTHGLLDKVWVSTIMNASP